jgi:hypothetical protein
MSFEYSTSAGVVRLAKAGGAWTMRFTGKRRGQWRSPDDAAEAVAYHRTGLKEWDRRQEPVSRDIIDWRPIGESI